MNDNGAFGASVTLLGFPPRGDAAMVHLAWRHARWPREGGTRTKALLGRWSIERALMDRSGRWRPGRADPERFVPGDAPIVRSIAAVNCVEQVVLGGGSGQGLSVLGEAYEAVLCHLDADLAVGLAGGAGPERSLVETLALPFASVFVCFGADLALPEGALGADVAASPEGDAVLADPSLRLRDGRELRSLLAEMHHLGGYLSGVVVHQGDSGRGLCPYVLWVGAANADPAAPEPYCFDRHRGFIIGDLRRSALAGFVASIAGLVAWGTWNEPDWEALPDPADRKAWKAATNTGRFRRAERSGRPGGVRVLDLGRSVDAGTGRAGAGGGAAGRALSPHWRRSHWRRVRVGPRSDWHYEGRLIAPTLVHGHGRATERISVYRIPAPGR